MLFLITYQHHFMMSFSRIVASYFWPRGEISFSIAQHKKLRALVLDAANCSKVLLGNLFCTERQWSYEFMSMQCTYKWSWSAVYQLNLTMAFEKMVENFSGVYLIMRLQAGSARYKMLYVWYPSSAIAPMYTNLLGRILIEGGLTIMTHVLQCFFFICYCNTIFLKPC